MRWTTALCTVPNLEYDAYITMSRDNTSSSIAFISSAWKDAVTRSPPDLAIYSSFSILSFLTIRKWTLEIVASTYTLVALAKATGCFHTSIMITCSSTCVGDVWSSKVDTLRDCTTLCCDSSNEMLCIYPSGWLLRILVPPWSLEIWSSFRCGEVGKSTSWWWSMRLVSCSNSCYSMSASNCWSSCSISWAKSCSCDGSPCIPDASWSDKSTTYMGVVSSIYTCCVPCCIYYCCASLSFFHNSCSFWSFSLSSCNSFSASSILLLSLRLCAIHM